MLRAIVTRPSLGLALVSPTTSGRRIASCRGAGSVMDMTSCIDLTDHLVTDRNTSSLDPGDGNFDLHRWQSTCRTSARAWRYSHVA